MPLVNPHGKEKRLRQLLLTGRELREARQEAAGLPQIHMNSRETSDLIMLGIGAFTPLTGITGRDDWRSVCDDCVTSDGVFWPIPVTLSITQDQADGLTEGQAAALKDADSGEIMGTITVAEKYTVDKARRLLGFAPTEDWQRYYARKP